MKPVNAAPDEAATECQELPSRTENVDRHATCMPCGRFGDFFGCAAPCDCQQNRACLRLWMSRRDFEKDSFVSGNS